MLLLLAACDAPPPDLTPVEASLGAAAPVSFAALDLLLGVRGEAPPCVATDAAGDLATAAIAVGDACPVPGIGGSGGLRASGAVDPESGGELAVDSTDAEGLRLDSAELVTVSVDDDAITVVFADAALALAADEDVTLGELALVATVDPGDPADGTDDRYVVDGAVQAVAARGDGEARARQLVFYGVELDAGCLENPIAGSVTVQDADAQDEAASVEYLQLGFHAACDGEIDVLAATGPHAAWSGRATAIELGR